MPLELNREDRDDLYRSEKSVQNENYDETHKVAGRGLRLYCPETGKFYFAEADEDGNLKITLPTGAATSAQQDDIITGLILLLTELGEKTEPADAQKTEEQESTPIDSSKNNPSFALTYTDGNLTGVAMTFGGKTYEKTLSYTDGELTGVSVWTEA